MNRDSSICASTRVILAAQTSMVAVFVASCGGLTPASSDAGSGPDCGPLTYVAGDACQPLQIEAGADGGRQGEVAGDATTEASTGLDRGGGAADASIDADAPRGGGDASADATTDGAGGGTPDASDGSSGTSSIDVVLSDTCSNGIVSIASDVLNPGDVYLDGTLQEGVCGADALTHWSDPNSACTGFDCYFEGGNAVIRPTDGRMIYYTFTSEYALREFHADSCPMPAMSAYPSNPLANDTIIPTPMCPTRDGAANVDVAGFVVSPDGDVYYHCFGSGGGVWYDLAGNAVYNESNGYGLIKVAHGHTALVGLSAIYKLANLTTGALTDVAAPPWNLGSILAIRAMDTAGFWVAVLPMTSGDPELWELHPDGTSTKVGSYPPAPVGQTISSPAALDGCGALLQISSGPGALEDTIVRRRVQGSSQVVYDEATNPLVKIHTSYLITGP